MVMLARPEQLEQHSWLAVAEVQMQRLVQRSWMAAVEEQHIRLESWTVVQRIRLELGMKLGKSSCLELVPSLVVELGNDRVASPLRNPHRCLAEMGSMASWQMEIVLSLETCSDHDPLGTCFDHGPLESEIGLAYVPLGICSVGDPLETCLAYVPLGTCSVGDP